MRHQDFRFKHLRFQDIFPDKPTSNTVDLWSPCAVRSHPSKEISVFWTSHVPQSTPFLFTKPTISIWSFYLVRHAHVPKPDPVRPAPLTPHHTSLVSTITLTRLTEKELNFLSLPLLHTQQYSLHWNKTPSSCSLIPKTKDNFTPTIYHYTSISVSLNSCALSQIHVFPNHNPNQSPWPRPWSHTLHLHNSGTRDQDIRTSHPGSLIRNTQTTSSPTQNSSHLYICSHVLRQNYSSQYPWYNDTGIRMGRCEQWFLHSSFPRWLLPPLLSVTPGCFMYRGSGTSALTNGIFVDTMLYLCD